MEAVPEQEIIVSIEQTKQTKVISETPRIYVACLAAYHGERRVM